MLFEKLHFHNSYHIDIRKERQWVAIINTFIIHPQYVLMSEVSGNMFSQHEDTY